MQLDRIESNHNDHIRLNQMIDISDLYKLSQKCYFYDNIRELTDEEFYDIKRQNINFEYIFKDNVFNLFIIMTDNNIESYDSLNNDKLSMFGIVINMDQSDYILTKYKDKTVSFKWVLNNIIFKFLYSNKSKFWHDGDQISVFNFTEILRDVFEKKSKLVIERELLTN